jgi:signal transduction histidine kinase
MGIGIWSMHFTGMQAFSLPVPVAYDWRIVLLSLLSGIAAAAVLMFVVSRQRMGAVRTVFASLIMGAAIVSVHYISMDAMRMRAECRYSPSLVALSVVVAILASLAGLRLALQFREEAPDTFWQKIAGAVVAGGAISAMHYCAMAAATFWPSAIAPDLSHAVRISTIGSIGISTVTLVVQGLAVLTSYVDRRLSLQRVQQLSSRLLRLQDEERRRIARDLHDDLGQALFAAKLNLSRALEIVPDEHPRKLLSEALDMIKASMEKVRTVAQLLHPPELATLGFKGAIVVYLEGFRERSGIQVELDAPERLPRLTLAAETALLRVIQESLLNVLRHSGSPKAKVRIQTDPAQLTLEVSDEGVGMEPEVLDKMRGGAASGVGTAAMSHRMEELGGRLEIASGRWGTSIKAILPLERLDS